MFPGAKHLHDFWHKLKSLDSKYVFLNCHWKHIHQRHELLGLEASPKNLGLLRKKKARFPSISNTTLLNVDCNLHFPLDCNHKRGSRQQKTETTSGTEIPFMMNGFPSLRSWMSHISSERRSLLLQNSFCLITKGRTSALKPQPQVLRDLIPLFMPKSWKSNPIYFIEREPSWQQWDGTRGESKISRHLRTSPVTSTRRRRSLKNGKGGLAFWFYLERKKFWKGREARGMKKRNHPKNGPGEWWKKLGYKRFICGGKGKIRTMKKGDRKSVV